MTTQKVFFVVIASLFINAPFVLGELLTHDVTVARTEFPWALFVGLWVEMALFVYLLMSVGRTLKSGVGRERAFLLGIQILILGTLLWTWVTLIIDQWPCFFLGGSGC